MLTVKSLMKRPVVTLEPASSVREALSIMAENGIRHLPVVDDEGHLLGIVAQQDVVRELGLVQAAGGVRGDARIRDVMSAPAWRATPGMPAHQAAQLMIEQKVGALPVVDGNGAVIGILTETDFVEIAREVLSGVQPESRAQT
jgi:CBS domain-containing protein